MMLAARQFTRKFWQEILLMQTVPYIEPKYVSSATRAAPGSAVCTGGPPSATIHPGGFLDLSLRGRSASMWPRVKLVLRQAEQPLLRSRYRYSSVERGCRPCGRV